MIENLCIGPLVKVIKCHPLLLWTCILLMISLITYLNLTGTRFGDPSYQLSGPGEISIDDFASDFSQFMCSSYNVTTTSDMDVFLVTGRPEIDPINRTIITRQASDLFPGRFISKGAFYLLEGSILEVKSCLDRRNVRNDIFVMIFRGDNSWNSWTDGSCENCPIRRENVDTPCSDGETKITFNVEERDTYYVTVTTGNDPRVTSLDVTADLKVNGTTFDTSNAKQSCRKVSNCFLNLDYSQDESVVAVFSDDDPISFRTKCSPRAVVWAGLFIILPAVIILISTVVYFLACRKKKSVTTQTQLCDPLEEKNDKMKLVSNLNSNPRYQTVYSEYKGSV